MSTDINLGTACKDFIGKDECRWGLRNGDLDFTGVKGIWVGRKGGGWGVGGTCREALFAEPLANICLYVVTTDCWVPASGRT